MKKTWNLILKIVIAVASAVVGVISGQAMNL
ncbi:smalltalk protein [Bacteroides fluxus]|jgi:hypothetical protein|nr:smalltalk protein [Bacteroides fluxus]